MKGQWGPQHVGGDVLKHYCNSDEVRAFVCLHNWIILHGTENVKLLVLVFARRGPVVFFLNKVMSFQFPLNYWWANLILVWANIVCVFGRRRKKGKKKNTQREVYSLPTRTLVCEREHFTQVLEWMQNNDYFQHVL